MLLIIILNSDFVLSPYRLKCLPLATVLRGPLVGECVDRVPERRKRHSRTDAGAGSADSQSDESDASTSSSGNSRYYTKKNRNQLKSIIY